MPTSSLTIADGLLRTNPGAVDPYYDGGNGAGYANLAAVYAAIPVPVRTNKTFLLQYGGVPTEYWWENANTADGQEVLKNTGGGGGSGIGPWAAVQSQNAAIINQDIDFEFNNGTNLIIVRGQFYLASTFAGTNILLGQLPAGNYPKSQLKKLLINGNVYAYLTIDNAGNISLVSRDGFNLPTIASGEPWTIETLFKPVTGGGNNINATNGLNQAVTVTIYNSAYTPLLNFGISANDTYTGYINPALGPFNITIAYPAGTNQLIVNGNLIIPNPSGGGDTFTNQTAPITITIS